MYLYESYLFHTEAFNLEETSMHRMPALRNVGLHLVSLQCGITASLTSAQFNLPKRCV